MKFPCKLSRQESCSRLTIPYKTNRGQHPYLSIAQPKYSERSKRQQQMQAILSHCIYVYITYIHYIYNKNVYVELSPLVTRPYIHQTTDKSIMFNYVFTKSFKWTV